MVLEDNVKRIVEQVISQINERNRDLAITGRSQGVALAESGDGCLPDLSAVSLQSHLQVAAPLNREFYLAMKKTTPARIGVGRCGTRPLTETLLRFRADHATAQDAVLNDVTAEFVNRLNLIPLHSACRDKDEFLTRPDLGRKLNPESLGILRRQGKSGQQLQIIVVDGLSSTAVETNAADLLAALMQGLAQSGVSAAPPLFVRYGRVAVMDVIGEELKPEAALVLIGERPGLGTAESLSAYIAYRPRQGMVESERTVVSNIHKGGTPASEAGAHLATVIKAVLNGKASGVNLSLA